MHRLSEDWRGLATESARRAGGEPIAFVRTVIASERFSFYEFYPTQTTSAAPNTSMKTLHHILDRWLYAEDESEIDPFSTSH